MCRRSHFFHYVTNDTFYLGKHHRYSGVDVHRTGFRMNQYENEKLDL